MPLRKRFFLTASLTLSAVCGLTATTHAETPAARPAVSSPPHTLEQLSKDLSDGQREINALLGKNNVGLTTVESRRRIAAGLTPLLRRMTAALDELTGIRPEAKPQVAVSTAQLVAMGALLGDDAATARIRSMAASPDPADAVAAEACGWLQTWYAAPQSDPDRLGVMDELDALARKHADSDFLARLTTAVSREAASTAQTDRLLHIVAGRMRGPAANAVKGELLEKKAAAEQDAKEANTPLTLKGTLVDGRAFSTADWKGKVVLVDFWAVWCGPCRAELPKVKRIYDAYHAQGLEVIGVSNDFDLDGLKSFVASAELPWPHLFDAAAAAAKKMHPITVERKIDGIPVMYLIDKKGILRTVNARMNMDELIPKLLAEPG